MMSYVYQMTLCYQVTIKMTTDNYHREHDAAIDIGCRGGGNRCVRGPCFKRAMDMFASEGMEGCPKEIVLALLKN